MNQQTCPWPSARDLRQMNQRSCHSLLSHLGLDRPENHRMTTYGIRGLIRKLKRQTHQKGTCVCRQAASIPPDASGLPPKPAAPPLALARCGKPRRRQNTRAQRDATGRFQPAGPLFISMGPGS